MLVNSGVAERSASSQQGLGSTDLVILIYLNMYYHFFIRLTTVHRKELNRHIATGD
jgi:hypothetical protein